MVSLTKNFELKGLDEFKKTLKELGDRAPKAAAKALYQEAERIMAESKKICPVDTGNLRATGHVELPKIAGKKVSVRLGYGGTAGAGSVRDKGTGRFTKTKDVGYAVWVHEVPAMHKAPTQWKFLETPFLAALNGMDERLAATIRPMLEKK